MELMQLFTAPAFWFDFLCVIVLVTFCARYVRLGFLAAVVQICGTVLSLIGAHLFASFADSWVYETFFEKSLALKVENLMLENGENGIEALSETLLSVLPESLQGLWQSSWGESATTSMVGDVDAIVQVIMESTVAPIITQILFMVLFFGGFLVCRLLVFLLVKALRVANYIPVFGSVNRVLGWLFGTIGGCIDLYLAFCVLWVFILLTDGSMPVLNASDLANSYLFELFQIVNPFL